MVSQQYNWGLRLRTETTYHIGVDDSSQVLGKINIVPSDLGKGLSRGCAEFDNTSASGCDRDRAETVGSSAWLRLEHYRDELQH